MINEAEVRLNTVESKMLPLNKLYKWLTLKYKTLYTSESKSIERQKKGYELEKSCYGYQELRKAK